MFPDGVAFVSLAAVHDPNLVPAAIARALDVQEAGQHSIVDNIASAIGEQRALPGARQLRARAGRGALINDVLVACPRPTVLVTSRAALHLSGEQLVLVTPLPLPDPERALPLERLGRSTLSGCSSSARGPPGMTSS